MPVIEELRPDTFTSTLEVIEEFQNSTKVSWYRGVGNASHKLLPSLFRHPKSKTPEAIIGLERDLATSFDQRSPPFVHQAFKDEWDRIFFMQHYGIPTRLLDWTESPLIALYFALTACERAKSGKPKNDAVLWMVDPVKWNMGALRDISYAGGIVSPESEQLKGYGPQTGVDDRKTLPVMIYGTHNSPRIVAQRGMFALFGKGLASMEDVYCTGEFQREALKKIVIDKSNRDAIAASLFRKGVSDSTIYPDLEGLSLELKRSYGFQK